MVGSVGIGGSRQGVAWVEVVGVVKVAVVVMARVVTGREVWAVVGAG